MFDVQNVPVTGILHEASVHGAAHACGHHSVVRGGLPAEREPENVVPTTKDVKNGLIALPPVEDRFIKDRTTEIAELNRVEAKYWHKSADVQRRGDRETKVDGGVHLNLAAALLRY